MKEAVAPDLVGSVVGIRAWGGYAAGEFSDGPVLGSGWYPGKNIATCVYHSTHVPAENNCSCGWYAYHGIEYFDTNGQYGPIWGAVRAWGKIAVHRDGFRAQYAEILAVAPAPGIVVGTDDLGLFEEVAEAFNVPLLQHHELEEYAAQFGGVVPPDLRPVRAKQKSKALINTPNAPQLAGSAAVAQPQYTYHKNTYYKNSIKPYDGVAALLGLIAALATAIALAYSYDIVAGAFAALAFACGVYNKEWY